MNNHNHLEQMKVDEVVLLGFYELFLQLAVRQERPQDAIGMLDEHLTSLLTEEILLSTKNESQYTTEHLDTLTHFRNTLHVMMSDVLDDAISYDVKIATV